MKEKQKILILDFGSQYTHLIARKVREARVYSEVVNYDIGPEEIGDDAGGIILSGGPSSIYSADAPKPDPAIFDLGLPVLGICYGMQAMTALLRGRVLGAGTREYGPALIERLAEHPLFKDIPSRTRVWMSHGDEVDSPPPGFTILARSTEGKIAAFADDARSLYGLQFHPEVRHTDEGKKIIANFIYDICGMGENWTPRSFIEQTLEEIRGRVLSGKVICAFSGGVDSSVMTVLIHRAVGEAVIPVFIDNGMLRKDEAQRVIARFREKFDIDFRFVDASDNFIRALKGVVDPERKRKVIGRKFIEIFEREAKTVEDVHYLAQGTLYPDRIESVSVKGPSATIKSHHNVGGLPEVMNLKLIEPLRMLFKDEVREVGRELGLDREIVGRHPFPGPGLAIRIIGEVTAGRLAVLREADAIMIEEIRKARLYDDIWQALFVLLPVQSVGVMGDERTYENVGVIRAVDSTDGMTAHWSRIPADVLEKISVRVTNEVKGINRVCFDITSKPPSTIEWE